MAQGIGGVGRTPGQKPRGRRNWDRLKNAVDPSNAIQLSAAGKIILVIAPDMPLSQSSAGLAVVLDGNTLAMSSDGLKISANHDLSRRAQIAIAKQDTMAYTAALHAEAQAMAFFQGQM